MPVTTSPDAGYSSGSNRRLAQLLDHTVADPAAAMHRHPGGLVDGQQAVVFVQHRKLASWRQRAPGHTPDVGGRFDRQTQRRHSNLVARATRVSALARPLFTRTSPERMMR